MAALGQELPISVNGGSVWFPETGPFASGLRSGRLLRMCDNHSETGLSGRPDRLHEFFS